MEGEPWLVSCDLTRSFCSSRFGKQPTFSTISNIWQSFVSGFFGAIVLALAAVFYRVMLSQRTKQINTYGRRPKRVIDASSSAVSSNRTVSGTEIKSIFEDMPAPPPLKNLAAKMKKHENDVSSSKPKALSPKVVGATQRKKRLSPVKKRQQSRILEIKSQVACASPTAAAKPTLKKLQTPGRPSNTDGLPESPPRAPLSSIPMNIPGSPALMQKPRSQATTTRPLRLQKPLNNLVDVDIIVLDDKGHAVSKERRVSRTNVEVNPINRIISTAKQRSSTLTDSASDDEAEGQPRQPKRYTARKRLVLSSDDSDSDAGPAPSAQVQASHKPRVSSRLARTNTIVEVSVPPAPYQIRRAVPQSQALPVKPEIPLLATVESRVLSSHLPDVAHVLQDTPSPVLKPRQLTPIRGSRRRIFQPPSPPSPTVTDLDLTIDFAGLDLDHGCWEGGSDFNAPEYLKPLLEECHQERCGPHNFSTFIESFPCDPILQAARDTNTFDMNFKKIGEASYSEVFGIGDIVLKVIPLRDELRVGQAEEVDGPAPTDAKDVRKEIIVTRAMGEVYTGFTNLLKSYIVKGRYPEVLLQLWDEYNKRKGSESARPDTFKVSQIYAIIVLPNGGPDLEAYTFQNASRSGWRQACSLFWQVAKSLAHAEHLVSFEHRDLHWGQILVKNLPTQNKALKSLKTNQQAKPKTQRVYMDDRSHGIQATIIDLGLSRMDAGDGSDGERVHWTPFDEEVFMGEGDYQFDVYRMMKELSGNTWDGFHPITNVLWLHYLLRKILHSKGLKPPAVPRKQGSEAPVPPSGDAAFSEKDCYECLGDLENWLGKTIVNLIPSGGKLALKGKKGRRKTQAPLKVTNQLSSGPARAGEIVAYGVKKGWIRPSTLF